MVTTIHALTVPTAIFDLEDRFAQERGVRGAHPRPLGLVSFHATARLHDGLRQTLDPPLELKVQRNPSGYYVFFNEGRAQERTPRSQALVPGTYSVRVESRFYQVAERHDVVLPQPRVPYTFELLPGYLYPFPRHGATPRRGATLLRGSVHHRDGRGRAGVTVEAEPAVYSYRTDVTGQWVLLFPDPPPREPVTVRFGWPVGATAEVETDPLAPGEERSLPQTSLRGQVLTATGVPVEGATVEASGFAGSTRSRGDGTWLYYFDLNETPDQASLLVITPDGRQQTRAGVVVRPRATVVVEAFRFS